METLLGQGIVNTQFITFTFKYLSLISLNPYKIAGEHPVLGTPVTLKWYRGANRYNNGATRYGRQYQFRYLIGLRKEQMKHRLEPDMVSYYSNQSYNI